MTRKLKKVLALLLTLSMVMSMVTVGAMAKEYETRVEHYCVKCMHKTIFVLIPEKEPTCQEEGAKEHYLCTECGRKFHHDMNTIYTEWELILKKDKVSCDYSDPATCTSPATCKWCGKADPNGQVDPNNHAWGGWSTDTATCTEAGFQTRVCSYNAEHSETRNTEPLGHEWSTEWSKDEINHWHDCTRTGCSETQDVAAHTWDAGTVTKEPTETEKGVKTFTCTVCNLTRTEDIDPTGSTTEPECKHENVTYTDNKDGTHDGVCANSECGELRVDNEAHIFEDGICTKCGAKEPCKHTSTKAVDNGDGITHKIVCAAEDCDYVETEEVAHIFDENGVCTGCGAQAVAQVGEKLFTTIKAAITAARDGDTVKVLTHVSENVVVGGSKDIILDLNGQTVFNGSYAITIQNKGVLTIQDSSEEQTGKVVSNGADDAIDNYGTLNVEAGTIQGGTAWYGIYAGAQSTTNVYGTAKVTGEYWGIAAGNGSETAKINVYGNAEITSRNPAGTNGGISASKAETKVYGNAKVTGPCGINTEGSLTISENAYIEAKHENAGTAIGLYKGANVKVEGGTVQGGTYGISGNGTSDGTAVTISGGTISGIGAGIYHPQAGTLTITGGEITGNVGVQMCDGELNVSGANTKITATGADTSEGKTGDGLIPDGAAISLVYRGATPGSGYGMPVANIEDGLFTSQQAKAVATYGWSNATPGKTEWLPEEFISGGYFSDDLDAENAASAVYLADTYVSHLVKTPEGYYHVHTPNYDDGVVTKQPTYTEEGERTFTCQGDPNNCTHSYTEPIPMLDRPTTPSTTYYTLTINYVDGEGNAVADPYTTRQASGWSYSVNSPAVEGMTPDQETVTGILNSRTEITVTYAADENVDDNQTPTTEAPETSEPTETQEPDETQPPEETEDLGENDTPLTETPDEAEDLGDNDTPLADVPQTGDMLWLWILLAVVSASGLIWISLEEKKGRRVA